MFLAPSPWWGIYSTEPGDLNIYCCTTNDLQGKHHETGVYYRTFAIGWESGRALPGLLRLRDSQETAGKLWARAEWISELDLGY